MGNDGYEGLLALRQGGAWVLGQSEQSCLIFGMPAQATREGVVNESLDIPGLAARISFLLGGV